MRQRERKGRLRRGGDIGHVQSLCICITKPVLIDCIALVAPRAAGMAEAATVASGGGGAATAGS